MLIYTYSFEGHLIFNYQIPEHCSWVEIKLKVPQTGDWVVARWRIKN
jgi:hypothetical protein